MLSQDTTMNFAIEELRPADWEQVRAIYLMGIASGEATFETEAPTWEQWDAAHLPKCRLVAQLQGKIVGWAALSPVSRRGVYAGVAEVSIYVHNDYQRVGVGKRLLKRIIEESEDIGIWTLQSSTFPENEASIALQKRCGFRVIGVRERIAKHNSVWRDTILLERRSHIAGNPDNEVTEQ
jgi:L-amino acid N-acyltransferase YncA